MYKKGNENIESWIDWILRFWFLGMCKGWVLDMKFVYLYRIINGDFLLLNK